MLRTQSLRLGELRRVRGVLARRQNGTTHLAVSIPPAQEILRASPPPEEVCA
jgi:hypothetical protein